MEKQTEMCIALNEDVCSRLRDVCLGTPLEKDAWFDKNMHTVGVSDFKTLVEERWVGDSFFGYERKSNHANSYIWFVTANRLQFRRMLPSLLAALVGLKVSVSFDSGWHWARGEESWRPSGKAANVRHYKLFVNHRASEFTQNEADLIAKNTMICESSDIRADRSIREQIEEAGIQLGGASFNFTENGFFVVFHEKGNIHEIQAAFHDCQTRLKTEGRGRGISYTLNIEFPKS